MARPNLWGMITGAILMAVGASTIPTGLGLVGGAIIAYGALQTINAFLGNDEPLYIGSFIGPDDYLLSRQKNIQLDYDTKALRLERNLRDEE